MPFLSKVFTGGGRRLFLVALCVFALPCHAQGLDRISLQLKWGSQLQFAGFYAAYEKGYYRDAGLDVFILEGGPQEEPAVMGVAKGRSTYGVAGAELLLWRLKGNPVVALAPIFQHSASVVMAREESGIFSPQDFADHRIEMGTKGHDLEIWAMLLSEGVRCDQFTRIPSTFNSENILSGRVDATSAYSIDQPFYLNQQNIPYRLIRPMQYGVDFYGDTLFTSEGEVENHPERVRKFLKASLMGWDYALSHPDEMISLMMKRHRTETERQTRAHLAFELKEMRRLILPDLVEIGHMNGGRWAQMAETFVRIGLVEPGYDLSGFIYKEAPFVLFDWNHWAMRTGAVALFIAMGGAISLGCYNRKMRAEISRRIQSEVEREELITELKKALDEVRELNGLLPICSSCLKIRNDTGYWEKLESYIESHTKARFSHGICNDCMKDRYPYLFDAEDGEGDGEGDEFYNKESGTFPPGIREGKGGFDMDEG